MTRAVLLHRAGGCCKGGRGGLREGSMIKGCSINHGLLNDGLLATLGRRERKYMHMGFTKGILWWSFHQNTTKNLSWKHTSFISTASSTAHEGRLFSAQAARVYNSKNTKAHASIHCHHTVTAGTTCQETCVEDFAESVACSACLVCSL